uniref:glutamine amidotransferase-related protein n=1 Tax=Thalassospira sp. SN3W TaxID=3035476 RepID=UPI004054E10B
MKILNIPGNIGALRSWLSQFTNIEVIHTNQISQVGAGELLVLPGGNVGGFSKRISDAIRESIDRDCRILAVCGSFQSLFTGTEETNNQFCLQLFSGYTTKLPSPRIGPIEVKSHWFSGSPYFNHSYAVCVPETSKELMHFALDDSGMCWGIKTRQILGVQFHPELSRNTFDMAFTEWLRDD